MSPTSNTAPPARLNGDVASMHNLVIRDGTSQAMRALPALQDGYFNLDELSFEDLVTMVTGFAAMVRFHNEKDEPDGDWKPFFRSDETVVMCRILAFDVNGCAARFNDWWRKTPEFVGVGAASSSPGWEPHALPIVLLVNAINDWYAALSKTQSEGGRSLRMAIESIIVRLNADRTGLSDLLRHESTGLQLDPVWSAHTDVRQTKTGLTEPERSENALNKSAMRADFHAFLQAAEMIRKEAAARLPASLQSQRHDPAISMLIAFAQQFMKLKRKLNRFTQNYLDFYYDEMLGCAPLPAVPDYTWLVFKKNPATRDVLVPARTSFLAGLDSDDRDILYLADNDLVVNDARVSALHTLYFDHNRYSALENKLSNDNAAAIATGSSRPWPTAASFNSMSMSPSVDDPAETQACSILGAPKNSSLPTLFSEARIGFALASNVLLLKEGTRKISVTISFEDDRLARRLEQVAAVMHESGDDDGNGSDASHEEIRRQDIFFKIFRSIFFIGITGEHGWIDVPDYLPAYDGQALTLTLELPPEAPSVVAYDGALHGEHYAVAAPMIRFVINPGAYLYPYGLLRDLAILRAHIEVEVSGCRDLVLYNNIGQLSAAVPFAPFGPLPRVGSYLIIGSTEMAGKRISAIDVEIEWADLPQLNGGFATYYDGYDVDLANDSFLATTAVLAKGAWAPDPESARPAVRLFRADAQRLTNRAVWSATPIAHLFEPDDGVRVGKPLDYSPGAKHGFFKFTLASPACAFGHDLYPHILSSTLTENARMKRLRRQRPVPRAPYTPQINAISVNYRAGSVIEIDRHAVDVAERCNRFIHLHAAGWNSLGVSSRPAPTLLPRFDFSGNLYIGIDAPKLSGTLTLFFQLREDSLPLPIDTSQRGQPSPAEPGLHWFYLANNEWKPLPQSSVISDGTQHFMTSGIVTLSIPTDISADNSVMPNGTYWLRVSADCNLDRYCSLYAVHTQAVQVRRSEAVSPQVPMVLPAQSISRSTKPLPGVTSILQPLSSIGGRAAETRAQLRTRVSERLRHKNRAVSAADYEALILQHFPEVYKVKCFANLATDRGPRDCLRPGHVLVVPLPYWPTVEHHDQMPMLNGNLMHEIRDFLKTLASPWSDISVENPVYERIQVRCKVKFAGGLGDGFSITQLDRAISDFLTPWHNECGYRTHFGWRIRQHDIEAHISALPYVESVTGFSMLRIASPDAQTYSLSDTAGNATPVDARNGSMDITPLCPWSIAIPVSRHAIDAIDDTFQHSPTRAALSRLEIGSTFIISKD
ncbi:MAG TPA: baseplate J/gp47 family protein [Trinickia sp.]|uniref:baseplate J/gp47 family protein n=1 Tax=Trinickia sp. TaxID=2571163 RepID=UPI002D1D630C|nr:baseplate J/gp47 family protein [Trinickia sp.]HTI18921.1 baseplate J/gp47 family protein [Trinickia sp.]